MRATLSRPLWILLLTGLAAGAAVLLGFAVPVPVALKAVRYTGYLFIFATFAAFAALLLWEGARERVWRALRRRRVLAPALLILGASVFVHLHEEKGFKVIMDEPTLALTSRTLHQERVVGFSTRAYNIKGSYAQIAGPIDKRPVFQPFLVSLVHDLVGYHPHNGVWLNVLVLTPVFFLLTYVVGRRLAGGFGGLWAVLLMAGIPHLARTASGGGFELLNLVMILLVVWLSMRYLEDPTDRVRLALLCLGGVLLGQVRYESILFVIPVGLVALLGWWRSRGVQAGWFLPVIPLLLLPWAWIKRAFEQNENLWQMADVAEATRPFGLEFVYANIGHAVTYFFDFTSTHPNSPLVVILGLVGVLLMSVRLLRELPSLRTMPATEAVWVVFLPAMAGLFLLLMFYFWGRFDDPVVRRLALPFYIPLTFGAVFAFGTVLQRRSLHAALLVVTALFLHFYTVPVTAQRPYTHAYLSYEEEDFVRGFIAEHGSRTFIMVGHQPIVWLAYEQRVFAIERANERLPQVKFLLDGPDASPIYVFERMVYDAMQKKWISRDRTHPDPALVLEHVDDIQWTATYRLRLHRLVDVEGVEAPEMPPLENIHQYHGFRALQLP